MKQLEPFFQHMKLRHITPLIIEQYKTMRLETVKKRTINRELSYLSKFLDFCGCDIKPVKFRKKDCQAAPPDILTIAELETVINLLPPPIKHLVQLMSFNGLRKSEAFQIRSIQADTEGKLIRVLGKGGKWRMAPVELPDLQNAIKEEKKKRPTGYLFPNPATGKPYTDIRRTLKNAAAEAGITKPVYNHLCRHSFATAMVGQGVNLRIIQGLLGHSDLKMVEAYTHLNDNMLRTGTATLVAKVATPQTRTRKGRKRKP
jgi:integrase/recombinase XerD